MQQGNPRRLRLVTSCVNTMFLLIVDLGLPFYGESDLS